MKSGFLLEKSKLKSLGANGIVFLSSMLFASSLFANPALNNVSSGQVSVQQSPNSTVINQSSQKTILNWNSFNIGPEESTHFQQPAGGVALNRISPNQGASQIYGRLTATGQIILINPAGLYFGPSAYVNVGGLVASTADITDQNFLSGGPYQFTQSSAYPNSSIINEGQIIAAQHGLVAVVAPNVINHGLIEANLGTVALASGNAFTINFDGNGLISFAVDARAVNGGSVINSGTLRANGGKVIVSAQAASGVLDNVINMSGVVEARSVGVKNGEIIFSGDPHGGVVKVSGKVYASGRNKGERGGNVTITGNKILLESPAIVDVSGDLGGGNIYIGGNYQGKGPLPNSYGVVVQPGTQLLADATRYGNGGEIILWSDNITRANGLISAKGGSEAGNGGFIETSSHGYLDTAGINVDTSAANGAVGTWLLDPSDLNISNTSPTVDVATTPGDPFIFTADNNTTGSNLFVDDLTTALASSNVLVSSPGGGAGLGSGIILISTPITWGSANSLTLDAFGNVEIDANILGSGALTVNSGTTIVIQATSIITGGTQQYNAPILTTVSPFIASTGGSVNFASTFAGNLGTENVTIATGVGGTASGVISNINSLTKQGVGTFNLAAANTYDGTTVVTGGTLFASDPDALGTTAAGTIVNGGSTLNINNVTITGEAVALNNATLASTGGGQLFADITLGIGTNNFVTAPGGGSLDFFGNINGAADLSTLGAGGVVLIGNIGNTTPLTSFTSNLTGVVDANVFTTGDQVYGGALIIGAPRTFNSSGGNILFGQTIDSDGVQPMTVISAGSTTFNGAVGIATPLGTLDVTASSININGGSVASSGSQTYNGPVVLGADTTFSGNNILFGSTLSSGSSRNATITDAGTTTLSNTVSGIGNLTINGGGATSIGGGLISTTGTQTYNNPITLTANTNFLSTGGDINFNNTVDGTVNLTINSAGSTFLGNNIGVGGGRIVNLTVAAAGINVSAANIGTSGNQDYTGLITLLNDSSWSVFNIGGNNSITIRNGVQGPGTLFLSGSIGTNSMAFILSGALNNLGVNVSGEGGPNNTLQLNNALIQNWNVTGANSGFATIAGSSAGVTFQDIQNLIGGSGPDAFNILSGSLAGSIDAGSGNDIINLSGGSVAGNVSGGLGNDGLTGSSNTNNTWTIIGINSGTVNGIGGTFNSIENLNGGNNGNVFRFTDGSVISGFISGGTFSDLIHNTMDFRGYTSGINVVMSGTHTGRSAVGDSIFARFGNIDDIVVASAIDNSLKFPNKSNSILFTAPKAGSFDDPTTFSGFTTYISASGTDTINFVPGLNFSRSGSTITVNGVPMNFEGFNFVDETPILLDVSKVIQEPTTNAKDSRKSLSVVNAEISKNLDDLINETKKAFDTNLDKIKINPYCSST